MARLDTVNQARQRLRTWAIRPPAGAGLAWSETFRGRVGRGELDFNQALLAGEEIEARLELRIDDVARYIAAVRELGNVPAGPSGQSGSTAVTVTGGHLTSPSLGVLTVREGLFFALQPAARQLPVDRLAQRMRYHLTLDGPGGGSAVVLEGFKLIENDPGYDSWSDSTTLFFSLRTPDEPADPGWTGVLRISPIAFLRELLSFRGRPPGTVRGARAVLAYGRHFAGETMRAYAGRPAGGTRPAFPQDAPPASWEQAADPARQFIPLAGGRLARAIVPFGVPDLPFHLNLHRLRLQNPASGEVTRPGRGPVLLVPGSGVRAQMYYGQPHGVSLAEYLLAEGFDVWVESWRASIDLPPNPYTWDHAARYDHPTAVRTVLETVAAEGDGEARLAVVAHCQGSISFLMAAVAGFIDPRVDRIVSSAVSLFIEVGEATYAKQRVAIPALSALYEYVDAQWGIRPINPSAAVFTALARLGGPDCGNPTCRIANFMYGSGPDVLLRHANDDGTPRIIPQVHDWIGREVGATPMSLIAQVGESSRRGHVVPSPLAPPGTPADYLRDRPQTAARFRFIAGDRNRMFDPAGQQRSCEFIQETVGRDNADFVPLPGYGHLDTFWGRSAATDVFGVILDGLRR